MTNNVFAADVDFFEDTTNQLNTTNATHHRLSLAKRAVNGS